MNKDNRKRVNGFPSVSEKHVNDCENQIFYPLGWKHCICL